MEPNNELNDVSIIGLFLDLIPMPRKIHLVKPQYKSDIALPEGVENKDLLYEKGGLVAAVGSEVEAMGIAAGDRAWPTIYGQPEMAFEREGHVMQVFDVSAIATWKQTRPPAIESLLNQLQLSSAPATS